MKIKLWFIFIILGICILKPLFGQDSYSLLVEKHLGGLPDNTVIQMAVFENGSWEKSAFTIRNGAINAIECKNNLFEIGSITKVFTASLVMKLSEEDKINIEDPIQDYLPIQIKNDSFQSHTVQIKHLLTHTSGLSNGPSSFTFPFLRAKLFSPKNPNKYFKVKHMYKYLEDFELNYIPGQSWDYNNLGYGLLGSICENITQTSWEELIQQEIFTPLKMDESIFKIDKIHKDKLLEGITAKGKTSTPWDMDFINPAGCIKSTLDDMIKFMDANLDPNHKEWSFLSKTQIEPNPAIKIPEGTLWKGNSMATGWWINKENKTQPFYWHAGASGGYTSFAGFSQKDNKAVILLSNISSNHPDCRGADRIPKPIKLGQEILRN